MRIWHKSSPWPDLASGAVAPFAASLDAMLSLVAEDADALGCTGEVEAARDRD